MPLSDEYPEVSLYYTLAVERDMKRQKAVFCSDFLERKKGELDEKKFNEQRAKLEKRAAECWDLAQEGKRRYRELEEKSGKKLIDWEELEKPLRQWLENKILGTEDENQATVERTIPSYRKDFDRKQNSIKTRQRRIKDPDADFRKRVLNPETREAAIRKYVQNHIHSKHYTVLAFNIVFEELEKRR